MTNEAKQTEWPPACTAMTPGRNKRGPACYLATFKWRGRPPAPTTESHAHYTPLLRLSVGRPGSPPLPSFLPPLPHLWNLEGEVCEGSADADGGVGVCPAASVGLDADVDGGTWVDWSSPSEEMDTHAQHTPQIKACH